MSPSLSVSTSGLDCSVSLINLVWRFFLSGISKRNWLHQHHHHFSHFNAALNVVRTLLRAETKRRRDADKRAARPYTSIRHYRFSIW
uniref:Uncharacterized protein n=1 Tax=Caenorhabditis japonica TaxID=281687 RepID=A0A8R1IGS4_CAEJA